MRAAGHTQAEAGESWIGYNIVYNIGTCRAHRSTAARDVRAPFTKSFRIPGTMTASHTKLPFATGRPTSAGFCLYRSLFAAVCLAALPLGAQESNEPIVTLEKMVATAKAADIY